MMKIEAKNRGTHLDELLREDGTFDELSTIVTKERIVWLLEKEMKKKNSAKSKWPKP